MSDTSNNSYENALRNTLMNRTGRRFKRDVKKAVMPEKQEQMSKEETVELIFDNILKKRDEKSHAPDNDGAPEDAQTTMMDAQVETPSHINKSYGDVLDEILWPDQSPPESSAPESPETVTHADSRLPDYKSILKNTLMNRTNQTPNSPTPPVQVQSEAAPSQNSQTPQNYENILDDILGMYDTDDSDQEEDLYDSGPSLTKTSYSRQLDSALWPEQDSPIEAEKKKN